MARKQVTQPAPSPVAVAANEGTPANKPTLSVVAGNGTRNIFTSVAAETSKKAADKVALMGSVRQQLAEARDYFRAGDDKAKEATGVADKAAIKLYQAQTDGLISKEELSATLGDIFGFKKKADGTDGKTPDGQGEAIRKRVVRAVQASDYVYEGDGGTFFAGLPSEAIADVLNNLSAGSISIWRAYDIFAEIKRDHAADAVHLAFNVKKIAELVAKLSEEGSAAVLRSSPALIAAYGALIEVLGVIGAEEDAAEVSQAA